MIGFRYKPRPVRFMKNRFVLTTDKRAGPKYISGLATNIKPALQKAIKNFVNLTKKLFYAILVTHLIFLFYI